jgi:nicotinamidase-related amidase
MSGWEMKGKPALVILHMQQGIVGRGSMLPEHLAKVIKEAGIIPRQQALLKAFRNKKLPVIYVNALANPTGILPAYGDHFRRMEAVEQKPEDLEIIPELAPQPGEPVLANWLLGAFTNSGLAQVLKSQGAETLVLVGFSTHMAVYNAAIQAVDLLYSVIVARDACASPQAEAQKVILGIMAPDIALVTTTEDIIAHL